MADDMHCPLGCGPLEHDPTPLRDNRFGLDYVVTIAWCPTCGLGVTVDPPDDATLAALYESAYDAGAEREYSEAPRTSRWARAWHRVNGSLPLSDLSYREPVLDVGSNRGDLLVALRERGIAGDGLEPNRVAAEFARGRGLQIVEAPIEDAELPTGRYGSIVLSQVLEHVRDPHAVLRRVRTAAAPDATVYVVVPNVRSVWRSAFGADWVHWHVPFHLYHHTERSLSLLLRQSGYTPVRMASATPGEWLLMSIQARRNARRGVNTIDHFSGRYLARLALAAPARAADLFHRGDAIVAEART